MPFQFRENACRPHSRPRAVARPAGTGVVVADGDDEGHISRVPRTSALASTLSRARDVVKRRSIAQRPCRFKRANPSGGVATGAVRARLRRAVRVDAFVVADDSPRGDLDAVARGFAAVVSVPTWPFAHAFALTDRVFLESLREDVATGLPSFLIDP